MSQVVESDGQWELSGVDVGCPGDHFRVVGVAVELIALWVEGAPANNAVVGLELAQQGAVHQIIHANGLVVWVQQDGLLGSYREGKDHLPLAVVDNLRIVD